jgi:hypothetical protein
MSHRHSPVRQCIHVKPAIAETSYDDIEEYTLLERKYIEHLGLIVEEMYKEYTALKYSLSVKMTERTLFLISGKVGVGKDTVGSIIQEKYPVYRHANADPLKNITSKLVTYFQPESCPSLDVATINSKKDCEDEFIIGTSNMRDVLYHISRIIKDDFDDDVWIELFFKRWRQNGSLHALITDIRLAELMYSRRLCPPDIKIIHLHIEGESRREYKDIGFSMNDVFTDDKTIVVKNDGTLDELKNKILAII